MQTVPKFTMFLFGRPWNTMHTTIRMFGVGMIFFNVFERKRLYLIENTLKT